MGILAAPLAAGAAAAEGDGARALFRFDDEVTESSGLVDLGSRVLTVNDSGDDAVVYVIDARTGVTVGRTTYADEVSDVEALALGPDGDVWVGDIGDNGGSRAGITVHRIPRPRDGDRRVEAVSYDLVYRGGARDAETLLVSPQGRLHVVSKGLFGGQVFEAPQRLSEDRPNVLTPIGDTGGLVTDGAWAADGRHVVLRDYGVAHLYDAARRPWRYLDRIDVPDQEQGEGIAVRRDGDLLVSSEGSRQAVLEVALPRAWRERMVRTDGRQGAGEDDGTQDPSGKGLGALVEGGGDLRRTVGGVVAVLVLALLAYRWVRLPRR